MIQRNEILRLVDEKLWDQFLDQVTPNDINRCFNFEESMKIAAELWMAEYEKEWDLEKFKELADHLPFKTYQDDSLKEFALNLFVEIRKRFPEKWKADWKNDAFVGIAHRFLCKYQEAYEYYREAYNSLNDPPHTLLLLLAQSAIAPEPPITHDQAREYTLRALEKALTMETAMEMRALAHREGDMEAKAYWDKMVDKLNKEGLVSPCIVPNVLKGIFKIAKGYTYEE